MSLMCAEGDLGRALRNRGWRLCLAGNHQRQLARFSGFIPWVFGYFAIPQPARHDAQLRAPCTSRQATSVSVWYSPRLPPPRRAELVLHLGGGEAAVPQRGLVDPAGERRGAGGRRAGSERGGSCGDGEDARGGAWDAEGLGRAFGEDGNAVGGVKSKFLAIGEVTHVDVWCDHMDSQASGVGFGSTLEIPVPEGSTMIFIMARRRP
jgi:hypothetical protein